MDVQRETMNACLKWFQRIIGLSIILNLGFSLPALFAPDVIGAVLGVENVEFSYVFVGNVGMLLVQVGLYYLFTAQQPDRYHVYSWLAVVIHAIAATGGALQGQVLGTAVAGLEGLLALVLAVLLQCGLEEPYRFGGRNLVRAITQGFGSSQSEPSNRSLTWFSRLTWLGILVNLGFALPALLAPEWLSLQLQTGPLQSTQVWCSNAGLLLLQASLLYTPAAINPRRYHSFAWLSVFARAMAASFWFWQNLQWAFTGPLQTFFITDGLFALVFSLLLQRGLPPEQRFSASNVARVIAYVAQVIAAKFHSPRQRLVGVIVTVAVAAIGYSLWDNLMRAEPDTVYASPEEQFKHGAIGLGMQARIPLYLWEVMPELCADLLPPGPGGWASFGIIYEEGNDLPIGFARRHIGYPSVEPTCSACHTGSYRASPDGKPNAILGGPSHQLDLQAFQWFLYGCVSHPNFTTAKVLAKIREKHKLSMIEGMVYRFLIIPFTQQSLKQQEQEYAWQKSRPIQGRGRTDTFNPTKFNVFHLPDDHSIGTVELPAIWNQRAREGLSLHWDGNNNAIRERNYAAAMAIGATPKSVMPDKFKLVTDYVLSLPPPKYPFPIDSERASRGWLVYQDKCAYCHDLGSQKVGTVEPIAEIGTDRHRLDSFSAALVTGFHGINERPFVFDAYSKTNGYSNLPIDGAWARAPYLHNGSVPTLWDLLQPTAQRPGKFYTGYDVYDPVNLGFVSSGPEAEKVGFLFDTTLPGNGNQGHEYGTDLSDEQKKALLEYLKTL